MTRRRYELTDGEWSIIEPLLPNSHPRYDRCAHTFLSTICIAATVIFWLPQ